MNRRTTPIIERRPLRRVLLPFSAGIAIIFAVTAGTAAFAADSAPADRDSAYRLQALNGLTPQGDEYERNETALFDAIAAEVVVEIETR